MTRHQDSIYFSPDRLAAAEIRLRTLLDVLLNIEEQRGHEAALRGGAVNERALAGLQHDGEHAYKGVDPEHVALLVHLSSFDEVGRWRSEVLLCLNEKAPIPYEEEYWDETSSVDRVLFRTIRTTQTWLARLAAEIGDKPRVFIAHGHDEALRRELARFLAELALTPVVLQEEDDAGMTIIEKFEHYASRCAFAFVLLTPDDSVTPGAAAESAWRTRQNVIMEMGWFMARLGRQRVMIIYKGAGVEIPSNILGVAFLRIERSIDEVGERIRRRLAAEGLLAAVVPVPSP